MAPHAEFWVDRPKDKSCAAGKHGFCKHIAALAYKPVEAKMSGATELPKPVSCTDVCQQWGVPSIKAQQDPEKEVMKRKPLQEIVFEKHILTRDNAGGRKRKLPSEVNFNYSSRPKGEPAVDKKRVDMLCEELSKSKHQRFVAKFLSHCPEENSSAGVFVKENIPTPTCLSTAEVRQLVPRANRESHVFESTFVDWTAWQKGVHGKLGLCAQQKTGTC